MVGLLPNTDINRKISGGLQTIPRFRSRYSRFVVLMRYALPVVAGVVFLLLVIWPDLTPKPDRFALGISDLNVEIDGGQRVVNARFTGVDSENRPFSITADSAVQDRDAGSGVKLSRPMADVTLPSESWVAIAAPNGTFWRKRDVLNLIGGVDLFHDKGYEFRTENASIDFRNGAASGDNPVQGQGPFGTISAEGFRITDSGGRIFFSGKSTLVIFPTGNKPGA